MVGRRRGRECVLDNKLCASGECHIVQVQLVLVRHVNVFVDANVLVLQSLERVDRIHLAHTLSSWNDIGLDLGEHRLKLLGFKL